MIFSWLKYRSSFISRKVRRQNMEWSKGVIFLMATFWPEGLWMAELDGQLGRCIWTLNVPDHAVGTFSNDILDFILVGHIEGDLP